MRQKGFAGILILILIVAAAAAAFYLGKFTAVKQLNTGSSASPSPTPILKTVDTATWKTYASKDGGFSFKYPGDLVVATNPRNLSITAASFFKTKQDLDSYRECLRLGDVPEKEGGVVGRDWEGGCDVGRVLFWVSVAAKEIPANPELTSQKTLKQFHKLRPEDLIPYTDPKGRVWTFIGGGGIGESVQYQANLETGDNMFYEVILNGTDREFDAYVAELFRSPTPDVQLEDSFFTQILSTFEFTK